MLSIWTVFDHNHKHNGTCIIWLVACIYLIGLIKGGLSQLTKTFQLGLIR